MYLFSRSVRLGAGNPEKQLAWALKVTEKVNQISEVPVQVWSSVFSPRAQTLVWTATVDDLLTLETIEDKLISDSGYVSLVEEGATHGSDDPIDDALLQFVFADPATTEIEATYATTIQATLAPGGMARGIELGVETAQRAGKITGCPTSFGTSVTGTYGSVEWITIFSSIEQMQRGQEAIVADADFGQMVDKELSKVYLPGAQQLAWRKIA
ncbi:MAG TPA: hypothetical protein VGF51_01750 [Acidimicrobiales bacterium]|jgi:hypothetical protein